MPRITNLPTDNTVRDNDYLIGYDGDASNAAKKLKLSAVKAYVGETTLEGYRDGRFLVTFEENFLESSLSSVITADTLLATDAGTEEDDSITASNSTTLNVGAAIASVVFAPSNNGTIQEDDIIILENEETGDRDLAVVSQVDTDENTIELKSNLRSLNDDNNDDDLANYKNWDGSKGYAFSVKLYRFSDVELNGDLILHGDIKGPNGAVILSVGDVVTLSGDNDFTGNQTYDGTATFDGDVTARAGVTLEQGLTIGDDDANYTLPLKGDAAAGDVLSLGADDDMDFVNVNSLISFSSSDTNYIYDWAQGGNTGTIPNTKIPIATSTAVGIIKPGTNLSVSEDGTLSLSGSNTSTINVVDGTGDSDVDYDNATDIKFTGTAVADVTEDGTEVTIEINSGATIFGTGSTNVSVWAKGDDTSDIPIGKLGARLTNTGVYTSRQDFSSGVKIGAGDESFNIVEGTSAPSEGQALVAHSNGNFVPTTIPLLSAENEFTTTQKIQNANGGLFELRRVSTTPSSNHLMSSIDSQAYSRNDGDNNGLGAYQDFVSLGSRYLSNENFEYGQFRIDTNYVTLGDTPQYSTLSALTVDRTGMTVGVDASFDADVTLGLSSSDSLTINATAEFLQPITGAITEVVNDRDSSNMLKLWHGDQDAYDAIDEKDMNTIYFVEENE